MSNSTTINDAINWLDDEEISNIPKEYDWYERRSELRKGMVFNTNDGIVMLDRTVPGDGTRWYVADWDGNEWSYYDSTIEPGDLKGNPIDPAILARTEPNK